VRHREQTEDHDGLRIDWDMPIAMDDGVVLRADIYRPVADGTYPVIMSLGPYGKQLHFEDGYRHQWRLMCEEHPDVPTGSTNKYQVSEVVDPEKWVPDGYVVIRVDSRGAGTSQGVIDIWSLREAQDLAICVDWAGVQPWSNGKVGLNGISYFAENQWQTAALQPEHLAAICTWEGAADIYRDMAHHGGIFCNGFTKAWSEAQVYNVQNGRGANGYKSRLTGDWLSGPETLTEEQLGENRRNFYEDCLNHKLDTDEFWQSRMPDWTKVETPLLSSANWGGQGLHPRGNFEGFVRAAGQQKWLEVHGLEHWTEFYTDYGVELQKRFFGHFLKGEDTGWEEQPRVLLQVRHPGERFVERPENEWPIERTQWTTYFLDGSDLTLSDEPLREQGQLTYAGFGDGATFLTPPVESATEITGPLAAKLFVSSATEDADLFLVVRVFGPDLKEVVFHGALDPHTPSPRAGSGLRTASWTRNCPSRTAPTTRTTRSSRCFRARSTRSTWRSGRRASSSPRGTGSPSPCEARTTGTPGTSPTVARSSAACGTGSVVPAAPGDPAEVIGGRGGAGPPVTRPARTPAGPEQHSTSTVPDSHREAKR
jgi:predicted acyl esterase